MDLALEEARRAAAAGEVPVGAVLAAADGRLLACAGNGVVRRNDPTAHAEILALRQAGAALGNYRLGGCVLAVTLEPLRHVRGGLCARPVGGVVYGAADPRAGAVISRASSTWTRLKPTTGSGIWAACGEKPAPQSCAPFSGAAAVAPAPCAIRPNRLFYGKQGGAPWNSLS